LLDPGLDDPSEHLLFIDALMVGRTDRGRRTLALLGLARSPLEDARARWLMQIDAVLLLAVRSNDVTRTEARRLLIWSMQPDAPYSAMTRAYLDRRAPKLARPKQPHPFVELRESIRAFSELIEKHQEELRALT
jgi:hypothetical protein